MSLGLYFLESMMREQAEIERREEKNKLFKLIREEDKNILDSIDNGYLIIDINDLENSHIEYYGEMATVGASTSKKTFFVCVTPDKGRNDCYIKVCNNISYFKSDKVIRLSFFENKAFDHKGDGKKLWKDRVPFKEINEWMMKQSNQSPLNNWELSIWLWNLECGFYTDININDFIKSLTDDTAYKKLNSTVSKVPYTNKVQYLNPRLEFKGWDVSIIIY